MVNGEATVENEFTEEMIESAVADLMALRIPSLGARRARLIVRAFSGRHTEALDAGPEALASVSEIDPATRKRIAEGWERTRGERATISEIVALGVSVTLATRLRTECGGADTDSERTMQRISEDVYGYVARAGGDFISAERVRRSLKIPNDHLSRIAGGIVETLKRREARGDTQMDFVEVISKTTSLLRLPADTIRTNFWKSQSFGSWSAISDDHGWTFLQRTETAEAEARIARFAQTRALMGATPQQTRVAVAYREMRESGGPPLHELQDLAIRTSFTNRMSVIIGRAGTGKTTLTKELARAAKSANVKIIGCAPTGLAAARLAHVSGIPSTTIHRLLGISRDGTTQRAGHSIRNADIYVVDECSLLGIWLVDKLLQAIPEQASIVFMGDPEQMASMEPGAILRDLAKSHLIPTVSLAKVYRQEDEGANGIVNAAWSVLEGKMPPLGPSVSHIVPTDPTRCGNWASRIAAEIVKRGENPSDVRVISPMRAGPSGVQAIALDVRDRINPSNDGNTGGAFRSQDQIIYTENDDGLGLSNGDLGVITGITDNGTSVNAKFSRGRLVRITEEKIHNVLHAMCLTGHQFQGAELPQVVIPIDDAHAKILDGTWLYTTIARAKRRVVLVGTEDALRNAVARRPRVRVTGLPAHLGYTK